MNSKLSFKGASLFPCILASLLLCFIVSLLPCPLSAAPNLITYQGRLKESNLPVSGNRDITISLCDALADGAGTCYPSDRQSVYVSTGLFKHVFAVPGAVDLSSRDWWLQLKVDDTVLSPREQLSSVPYALNATTAAYANNLAASAGAAAVISSTHVYIVNGSSLTVSGDVSAHAFYGDGSGLSGLGGAASAGTANHIAGGSMGEILYQSGTDATAKLAAGDANKVLQANGAAAPSWTSAPTLTGTNFTGIPWAGVSKTNSSLADLATKSAGDLTSGLLGSTFGGTGANLSAAVAGGVPWFSATGVMGAVGAGTSGYFLKSNGAAAPEWVAPATVGAGLASNLAGGDKGSIPYQSAADHTILLGAGTAGAVLQTNGVSDTPPNWTSAPTLTGTNITGIPWAGVVKTNSSLADLATKSAGDLTSGTLVSARGGTGADLSGAPLGGVPWFSAIGVMGAVGAGTIGDLLKSNGEGAPSWVAASAALIGKASNLAGGDKGSIPYQSAADHTILLGAGTAGAVLQTNGVSDTPPSWTSAPTLTGTNFTGIPWAGVSKTNSSLADLATKSAGALDTGNLGVGRMPLIGNWVLTGNLGVTGANIGIGDSTPAALLTVGDGDLFQVDSAGNLVKVNNIAYSWPSSQGGASTFLKNDGSGNFTWGTPTADNLGTHVATTTLDMNGKSIVNASSGTFAQGVTASSFTATGAGLNAARLQLAGNVVISSESAAALGGGVNISSNVYIVGFSSAAGYYGDGSSLTGVRDNLGNHIATTTLNMATFNIVNIGSITANAAITTYSTLTVAGNALSVGGSTLVVTNGNVGIGTTVPTHKLHVAGNAIITSSMSVSGSGVIGTMPIFQVAGGTMTVLVNGNVGIGTDNPQAKLHVDGSLRVGNNFPLIIGENGGQGSSIRHDTANGETFIIATKNTISRIMLATNFDATTNPGGNLTFPTQPELYIFQNRVGIGTTSPEHTLDVNGDMNIAAGSHYNIGGTEQPGGSKWTLTGGDIYRYAGNVGIGITAPTYALHVVGSAIITSSMSVSGSGLSGATPVFQVAGGTMTVLANGNIGIGTMVPEATLDLKTGPGNTYAVKVSSNDGTELMVVQQNGKVGIGTTPSWGVDVNNGHIVLRTATTAATNGGSDEKTLGIGFPATTLPGSVLGALINSVTNGWGADIKFNIRDADGGNFPLTPAMVIKSGGNVGIGTAVPAHRLHVAGNAIITSSMSVSGSGVIGTMPIFQVAGGTMTVLANGNIGIGTDNPQAELDVNGDAKISRCYTRAPSGDIIALTAADYGATLVVNSAVLFILPAGADADIGATITVMKLGAGKVTIRAVGGDYIADSVAAGSIYNDAVIPPYATLTIRLVAAFGVYRWMLVSGEGSWITE